MRAGIAFTEPGDPGSLVNVAGAGILTSAADDPDAARFVDVRLGPRPSRRGRATRVGCAPHRRCRREAQQRPRHCVPPLRASHPEVTDGPTTCGTVRHHTGGYRLGTSPRLLARTTSTPPLSSTDLAQLTADGLGQCYLPVQREQALRNGVS